MKKYENINLPEENFEYIKDLISVLQLGIQKNELAARVKEIIERNKRKPINGLLSRLITDLTCHLDIYESKTLDFKFREEEISSDEGIKIYLQSLRELRDKTDIEINDDIYKIYERWIYIGEKRIEIEILEHEHWNYNLVKDIASNDYYFSMVFNVSAASWSDVVKVTAELAPRLELAIKNKDKNEINKIADELRNDYYRNRANKNEAQPRR
jgi:hypothetical protein